MVDHPMVNVGNCHIPKRDHPMGRQDGAKPAKTPSRRAPGSSSSCLEGHGVKTIDVQILEYSMYGSIQFYYILFMYFFGSLFVCLFLYPSSHPSVHPSMHVISGPTMLGRLISFMCTYVNRFRFIHLPQKYTHEYYVCTCLYVCIFKEYTVYIFVY